MKTELFQRFYKLGETEQRNYLIGLLQVLPVKRHRHGKYDEPNNSRRQCSIAFTVPDGQGSLVRVCKKTFMDIFGITTQKIATLVMKKKSGVTTFVDERGGKRGDSKYSVTERKLVREHINSFPQEVSHYCRTQNGTEKKYLSPDLNIYKLYRAFKLKYPDTTISHRYYYRVFKKDFPNLSFKQPRMDTCKTCDLLNLKSKSSNEEGRKAKVELELHHRKTEAAFQTVKDDFRGSTMPGSDTCTVTMDLQKVFPLPKLTHSAMYYSRQLSCFNFGIHIADSGDGIMCIWHEGQFGRGANQMASSLLQAINSGLLSTYKKKLTIWSDNCAGQLKNKIMLFTYMFLVAIGHFDVIDHKFLISGHSFSASDRDFALIEKRGKKSRIQTVDDVIKVIEEARPSQPFKILNLGEKECYDFNSLASRMINTAKLKISEVSWLRITKDNISKVFYKHTFNTMAPFTEMKILKPGYTQRDLVSLELQPIPKVVALNENKRKIYWM